MMKEKADQNHTSTALTPKCYSYIRFSTPDQMSGDSLRRQLELSEKYAKEHGLEIEDTLKLRDLGVSAFRGRHRTIGALGTFLSLVKQGSIVPGSLLLVESLDRLSREKIRKALRQFLDLIDNGIKIVTLFDNNREYTGENIDANVSDLIIALTIMARAHEESETKGKRIRAAWVSKRENVGEKKLTGKCPDWLKLDKDKRAFIINSERANIICKIFQLKLDGIGIESIAKRLNEDKETTWIPKGRILKDGRKQQGGGWRKSYVDKILRTRAVIGEYQPHKMNEEGTRVPEGQPITDYFPRIVPDDFFYAVQERLRKNAETKGNGGGRNGAITNLFGYIAVCGYCGSSMRHINTGKPPRGGAYLVCDKAKRHAGCDKGHSIKYPAFEKLMLDYCRGLRPEDILPGAEARERELGALRQAVDSIRGQITKAITEKNRIMRAIKETENPDQGFYSLLNENYKEKSEEIIILEKNEQETLRVIENVERAHRDKQASITAMNQLHEAMSKSEGQEKIDLRLRVRNELRSLIDRIEVFPLGSMAHLYRPISKISKGRLKLNLADPKKQTNLCEYHVTFKEGSERVLFPYGSGPMLEWDKREGALNFYKSGAILNDINYFFIYMLRVVKFIKQIGAGECKDLDLRVRGRDGKILKHLKCDDISNINKISEWLDTVGSINHI